MMIVWHATWSVTVGRIYAPSTAMWPNNNSKLQIIKQVHQWFMSPHGIVPFTRWQHRINVLYGKASSIHQRAPPVKYFKLRREGKTGPKFTKIAWDLLRTNARHHDKFHRAPKSNDVREKLQNKTHRAKRDWQTKKKSVNNMSPNTMQRQQLSAIKKWGMWKTKTNGGPKTKTNAATLWTVLKWDEVNRV